MENNVTCHPSTSPNTSISLISPKPIDSFLNKKSPKIFINNRKTKGIIIFIIVGSIIEIPLSNIFNINIDNPQNIKTSSYITIYSTSDKIIIKIIEINIKLINKSIEIPNVLYAITNITPVNISKIG